MKKWLFISSLLLITMISAAQPNIKTILPGKSVSVGEPFRIQFVVENPASNQQFNAPDFGSFTIIRGPEVYEGSQSIKGKKIQITNYIYTLVAEKPGNFRIEPATVSLNGFIYSGDTQSISVKKKKLNSKGEWENVSDYTLLPGEDPYKKMKDNLFVKLFVNKRSCLLGEPVVATFKLFSRLQSKSDIVKNPGFYGFSVYDMINLEDKVKEREKINGKDFDVHTIRKVQLYPLQAGEYTIDEMKIENKVEFSRSIVNKKTEQQISEGVLKEDDENLSAGSEVFEISLVTEPVKIRVNKLPQKNIPPEFNGAAGRFSINAVAEKNKLDKNEEGFLLITIEGQGNFTQLTAPTVHWPKELEGFEPTVKDFLDKRLVPLSGARMFRYAFISSHPGKWKIPAIRFSFFNTATKNYQTISSDSVFVNISRREFKKPVLGKPAGNNRSSMDEANRKVSRIAFVLVVLLIVAAISYWSLSGRRKKIREVIMPGLPLQSIDDLFLGAADENKSMKEFYGELHQTTWKYLGEKFNLSGTEMNKNDIANKLRHLGNDNQLVAQLINLLSHFETAKFTNIGLEENRIELMNKTKEILKQLKA